MGVWTPRPGGMFVGPPSNSRDGLYVPSKGELHRYVRKGAGVPQELLSAVSWYDARDLTSTSQQTLPNRLGAGVATLGSLGTSDTNDPRVMPATSAGYSQYLWFPGDPSGNNRASFANLNSGATGDLTFTMRYNRATGSYPFGNLQGGGNGTWSLYQDATSIGIYIKDNAGVVTLPSVLYTAFPNVTYNGTGDIWIRVTRTGATWTIALEAGGASLTPPTFTTPITVTTGGPVGTLSSTNVYRIMDGGSPTQGFFYYLNLVQAGGTVTVFPHNETLGQASWTCTTGQTVTVNRHSSGLTTAVVTRPLLMLDGTDDYIQLSATDTPTFTATTGGYTALLVMRAFNPGTNFADAWSARSNVRPGLNIYWGGSGSYGLQPRVGDAATDVYGTTTTITSGAIEAIGVVMNAGSMRTYRYGTGLSTSTSYAALGAITFASPRIGNYAYTVGSSIGFGVFSSLIFHRALTVTELDAASAYLLGSYA